MITCRIDSKYCYDPAESDCENVNKVPNMFHMFNKTIRDMGQYYRNCV